MNSYLSNIVNTSDGSSLVQAIHTAVKGRARFKVSGLHLSQSCKNYIERRLSQEKNVVEYHVNHFTGNVLVIFNPNYSLSAIASLLHNIVLDYRQKIAQPSVSKAATPIQPQLDKLNNELIIGSAVATVVVLSSGLIYKNGFDESILLGIQKLHNPLLDTLMIGITALGEPLVFGSICATLGINLWYNQRHREATTLSLVTLGTVSLNLLFKQLFRRARPTLWSYIVNAVHYSFPSGHAMVATAVYGYIGYIWAKESPQWRKQILGSTTALILAIGLSRLYLGVHWPTDVLAGYIAGILWLVACVLYLEWQQKPNFASELAQYQIQ